MRKRGSVNGWERWTQSLVGDITKKILTMGKPERALCWWMDGKRVGVIGWKRRVDQWMEIEEFSGWENDGGRGWEMQGRWMRKTAPCLEEWGEGASALAVHSFLHISSCVLLHSSCFLPHNCALCTYTSSVLSLARAAASYVRPQVHSPRTPWGRRLSVPLGRCWVAKLLGVGGFLFLPPFC